MTQAYDLYGVCIDKLREVARANGYALTSHGSLKRDIDLVAVPWTLNAVSAFVVAEEIRKALEALYGLAVFNAKYAQPELKAYGRLAWSIVVGGWNSTYIDLSVTGMIGADFFLIRSVQLANKYERLTKESSKVDEERKEPPCR